MGSVFDGIEVRWENIKIVGIASGPRIDGIPIVQRKLQQYLYPGVVMSVSPCRVNEIRIRRGRFTIPMEDDELMLGYTPAEYDTYASGLTRGFDAGFVYKCPYWEMVGGGNGFIGVRVTIELDYDLQTNQDLFNKLSEGTEEHDLGMEVACNLVKLSRVEPFEYPVPKPRYKRYKMGDALLDTYFDIGDLMPEPF